MEPTSHVSISVVVAAYQAERWIAEALESILGQTRPPDEVIVVDDGSTDGTAAELAAFGDRIRVVVRENGGCPAALNTAFSHVRGDVVALCGADDIWESRKLEWQEEAILAHPEADIFFGHAMLFDRIEADHLRPTGVGVLDSGRLLEDQFLENVICAPSVVIRRSLFERLGPFVENFGADDYEYWFRCLRAGVRFYYEPRVLLRWRQHGGNLSWQRLRMDSSTCQARLWYERDVPDRRLVNEVLSRQLFRVGRLLFDAGRTDEAREAFRRSLRYGAGASASANVRALVWTLALSLPPRVRESSSRSLVAAIREIEGLWGGRNPALP